MKIGIIGCGAVAPKHTMAYEALGRYEHFYFCDIENERALKLSSIHYLIADKVSVVDDYHRMIDYVNLDLISICTPPATHAEISIQCAEANVNVLCEKPIHLTLRRAQAMVNAFERSSAKLSIIFQNRWHPDVQRLRMEAYKDWHPIKAAMTVNWYRPDSYFEDWKGNLELGGDIVLNQIIHHLDILRFIFGEVHSLFAYTRNTRPEVISCMDVCTAVLEFKSGLIATLDATINCYPENERTELTVITDKGPISIVPKGTSHLHQITHVIESLKEGKQPEVRGLDSIESLKLALAVHESAWSGKEIRL